MYRPSVLFGLRLLMILFFRFVVPLVGSGCSRCRSLPRSGVLYCALSAMRRVKQCGVASALYTLGVFSFASMVLWYSCLLRLTFFSFVCLVTLVRVLTDSSRWVGFGLLMCSRPPSVGITPVVY